MTRRDPGNRNGTRQPGGGPGLSCPRRPSTLHEPRVTRPESRLREKQRDPWEPRAPSPRLQSLHLCLCAGSAVTRRQSHCPRDVVPKPGPTTESAVSSGSLVDLKSSSSGVFSCSRNVKNYTQQPNTFVARDFRITKRFPSPSHL